MRFYEEWRDGKRYYVRPEGAVIPADEIDVTLAEFKDGESETKRLMDMVNELNRTYANQRNN